MSTSSTHSSPLESLAARGYTLVIRDGKLALSPAGAPQDVKEDVRVHREELLQELLYVPEQLADWTLEEMRALAWRLKDYIDGTDKYERRIQFLPDFKRLCECISFRMEDQQ